MKILSEESGQGTTEMVFLIPLFVMLAAGAIGVAYMCWQGIKVQEGANVAARIAGQEWVGGAKDYATMMQDNGSVTGLGVNAAGDPDPTTACTQTDPAQKQNCLQQFVTANGTGGIGHLGSKTDASGGGATGVYWSYRKVVYDLFTTGEQSKLYVPLATTRNGVTEVSVSRVMQGPKVFGWQPPAITIDAKAYGGEDSAMYSLPRMGHTGNAGDLPFWEKIFKNNSNLKDPHPDQ